jgi:23S rRNA (pseudouridine1915-N3)-methyltransferase
MNWKIVTVGKPALPWARDAVADYVHRINRSGHLEMVSLREESGERTDKAMLAAGAKSLCIALDERGKQMRSTELAQWIKARELAGNKRVCIFVGGANGHSEKVRASAQECWSLSSFTLQHELALVVVLEQIYRAYSILRGEPYHRE